MVARMHKFFRINFSNLEERNAFYLSVEVIWAAVLIAAQSFFVPYAVRLGATNFEIGLFNSIPALLTIFLSIPVGKFLERQNNSLGWTLGGMTVNRLGFLFLALVPLVNHPNISKGTLVIIILIVLNLPDLLYKIGQWPFIMRLVPEDRRISVFTNRSLLTLIVTGVGVFLFGQWLNETQYPSNFQVMTILAVAVSQLSLLFWLKVKLPEFETGITSNHAITSTTQSSTTEIFRLINFRTDYGRVILNQIFTYIGIWTATPLYVLYTVRDLGASDYWIGLQVTVNSFAAIIGWMLARRLTSKWGEPQALKRCSQLVTLYPFLMGISPTLTPILFASALNSIVSPIFSLSHNNNLLRAIPFGSEHNGIALYNTLFSIGGFICPIIGVSLAGIFGTRPMLIGSGIISLIGSLSFHIWPVFYPSNNNRVIGGINKYTKLILNFMSNVIGWLHRR